MLKVTQLATQGNALAARSLVTRFRRWRGLLAVAAILSVVAGAAAYNGSAGGTAQTCGLSIAIQDPDIRAALVRFAQNQSPGAAKACAMRSDVVLAALSFEK